jgi:SNF family Na+-dependent transporter
MRVNVGRIDAWIRGALSLVFLIMAAVFSEPMISLAAALFALLFAATALTHSCPLYNVLGLDTRTHDSRPQHH